MSGNRRKAILIVVTLVGGGLLMTACQDTETGAAQGSSSATPVTHTATPSGSSTPGSDQGADTSSPATGKATKDGASSDTGASNSNSNPVEQSCGANDISWSTTSKTQAGGYILIAAKAKSGISCILPDALPTVAFGSDGTQARSAENAAGKEITLSGSTVAYAGVNPKSTSGNGGKELGSIIVGVGNDDPNPVSLPVGTITVEDPIVTNWHTSPTDAVPLS